MEEIINFLIELVNNIKAIIEGIVNGAREYNDQN